MFRAVPMYKTNLFILNKDLRKVSELLYDLKLVEFFNLEKNDFKKYEIEDLNEINSNLLKLRSIISFLKPFYRKDNHYKNYSFEEILDFKKRYEELKNDKIFLEDELNRLKILRALKINKDDLNKNNLIIGFVNKENKDFFKELKKRKIIFKEYRFKERIYFYLKLKKNQKIDLNFKEFYLPKYFDSSIEKKLNQVKNNLNKVKLELEKIANSSIKRFQIEELKLSKLISVNEIKHKFLKTDNITVLSSFIPKSDFKKLKRELEKLLGNKFVLEGELVKEDAPIKLNNPPFVNKFEALLKMYSLPKYDEFDPSSLLFLIFPLFFGFILGDVIYGLISLIFFTIIKNKSSFKDIKDFISILQISSISSIIFGFIFGEFMGFELHGSFYGFFNRAEDPETLLIIAVLFGLIHINLGLIIGFVNDLSKSIKKAFTDKASWLIMELGVGLISLGIYMKNDDSIIVGLILFILSLVLIYMGHGFIGIIEIPSFFTNIFSYARLMAVGLSSIAIAVLINDYTQVFFSKGILGILSGILLFTFGHIFNIVLGNFEGFVHTMRLHYVEFFTKFYEGGGREFRPFGLGRE